MDRIEITERFLMDTGGWQAMKHARALVEMGRVVSAAYNPPLLRGLVREGTTEYRAGMKILLRATSKISVPAAIHGSGGPSARILWPLVFHLSDRNRWRRRLHRPLHRAN